MLTLPNKLFYWYFCKHLPVAISLCLNLLECLCITVFSFQQISCQQEIPSITRSAWRASLHPYPYHSTGLFHYGMVSPFWSFAFHNPPPTRFVSSLCAIWDFMHNAYLLLKSYFSKNAYYHETLYLALHIFTRRESAFNQQSFIFHKLPSFGNFSLIFLSIYYLVHDNTCF